MIRRINDGENDALCALPEKGTEAQKIRALYLAYGARYDFCRFYRGWDCFIAALDGDHVLCCGEGADYDELALFFGMSGFSEIFCSYEDGEALKGKLSGVYRRVMLMECRDTPPKSGIRPAENLDEVFGIISSGFDIRYEPWYLDMSHRIRHGVSRCYMKDGAALAVSCDLSGEALISQVSVLPERRGNGLGRALVRAVSAELSPDRVYAVCEEGLTGFYESCGFELCGYKYTITPYTRGELNGE